MLKLIKKENALSKKDLSSTYGGSCGTMGCDCGLQGTTFDTKQNTTYSDWETKI